MSDPNLAQTEPIRHAKRKPYRNPWTWPTAALVGLIAIVIVAVVLVGF